MYKNVKKVKTELDRLGREIDKGIEYIKKAVERDLHTRRNSYNIIEDIRGDITIN